jgi:hypothetical protein
VTGLRVRRAALALLAVCAAAAWLASCAPPPRPAPIVDDMAAKYTLERDRRETGLHALTANLVVRVDGRATGRLPGLPATLALATPDRARLRVSALFGTALDVCAQGDSLLAWVPSERLALSLAGASETLGIAAPVELLSRAIGATWQPPREAWKRSTADSLGLHLHWMQETDTLEMRIDFDSRPAEVRLANEQGSVTVRYSGAWTRSGGAEWPDALEVGDATGWARVRIGVTTVRVAVKASDEWFALRVPVDAKRLDWDGLREWLDRRREGL